MDLSEGDLTRCILYVGSAEVPPTLSPLALAVFLCMNPRPVCISEHVWHCSRPSRWRRALLRVAECLLWSLCVCRFGMLCVLCRSTCLPAERHARWRGGRAVKPFDSHLGTRQRTRTCMTLECFDRRMEHVSCIDSGVIVTLCVWGEVFGWKPPSDSCPALA